MRVAIFNVKYSPNLGDGIIAECLEASLAGQPGIAVRSIDLAGRERYGDGLGAGRARILDGLHRLPRPARHLLVRALLGGLLRLRLRPRWRRVLAGCDVAIVGGGQLIADADLNFPLKLAAAAAEMRRRNLPLAVFAVGVAGGWSGAGRRLLRRLFSGDVVHIAVRDAASQACLRALLEPDPPAGLAPALARGPDLCRDPGLLTAEVHPRPPRTRPARPRIGLGITHPAVLRNHADAPDSLHAFDADAYAAMIRALRGAGYDVTCFTNGAAEDEACLEAVRLHLASLAGTAGETAGIHFADRPRAPADLARGIAGFDAVVAHRLHAHIVAYAYGIPSVGLPWDGKLPAFLASVGREAFMVATRADPAEAVAGLVSEALWTGIDVTVRAEAIAQTKQGILRMLESLRAEDARRRCAAPRRRPAVPARFRAASAG
ncbi:polysaccharide pyruvyl transferase family protein [Methylobacterium planeticum]|nr:polysaccharide pyruvyl transferase family protein [Methylobacterium planeticum]